MSLKPAISPVQVKTVPSTQSRCEGWMWIHRAINRTTVWQVLLPNRWVLSSYSLLGTILTAEDQIVNEIDPNEVYLVSRH